MAAPDPGVTPGLTGTISPSAPSNVSWSRSGVRAASSSVGPPGDSGRPPSPSSTSRTIFLLFGFESVGSYLISKTLLKRKRRAHARLFLFKDKFGYALADLVFGLRVKEVHVVHVNGYID